jgi:Putative adhesin
MREIERMVEQAERQAEQAERQAEEAERQAERTMTLKQQFDFDFDFDLGRKFNLELGRQFPVPPVPPVPPRDPRDARPREPRRRVPENWVETTEPYSRKFPAGKASVLLLVNISGNVEVSPGTGDQIEVQALKRVWAPNAEEGKKRLADVSVEPYATGNRVELRVEHNPRRNTGNVDVEFVIKVPPDGSVDLRSVSGDIRVTNVKGEVRAQIGGNGNLSLEGTPRVALAKTVGGDIQITNAGADTQLSLSTVGGNILAQTLNARILELNTVRGDVKLTGWTGDRANLRTLDGDLDLTASLAKGGRYEIESHSGNIRLSLPEQPGFELEANTYNGRIRVDFSIRSEGPIRDQERGPRFIRGTYGDGGSSLRVQTFSGDIVVTRR